LNCETWPGFKPFFTRSNGCTTWIVSMVVPVVFKAGV
jgi:hypothetical protein